MASIPPRPSLKEVKVRINHHYHQSRNNNNSKKIDSLVSRIESLAQKFQRTLFPAGSRGSAATATRNGNSRHGSGGPSELADLRSASFKRLENELIATERLKSNIVVVSSPSSTISQTLLPSTPELIRASLEMKRGKRGEASSSSSSLAVGLSSVFHDACGDNRGQQGADRGEKILREKVRTSLLKCFANSSALDFASQLSVVSDLLQESLELFSGGIALGGCADVLPTPSAVAGGSVRNDPDVAGVNSGSTSGGHLPSGFISTAKLHSEALLQDPATLRYLKLLCQSLVLEVVVPMIHDAHRLCFYPERNTSSANTANMNSGGNGSSNLSNKGATGNTGEVKPTSRFLTVKMRHGTTTANSSAVDVGSTREAASVSGGPSSINSFGGGRAGSDAATISSSSLDDLTILGEEISRTFRQLFQMTTILEEAISISAMNALNMLGSGGGAGGATRAARQGLLSARGEALQLLQEAQLALLFSCTALSRDVYYDLLGKSREEQLLDEEEQQQRSGGGRPTGRARQGIQFNQKQSHRCADATFHLNLKSLRLADQLQSLSCRVPGLGSTAGASEASTASSSAAAASPSHRRYSAAAKLNELTGVELAHACTVHLESLAGSGIVEHLIGPSYLSNTWTAHSKYFQGKQISHTCRLMASTWQQWWDQLNDLHRSTHLPLQALANYLSQVHDQLLEEERGDQAKKRKTNGEKTEKSSGVAVVGLLEGLIEDLVTVSKRNFNTKWNFNRDHFHTLLSSSLSSFVNDGIAPFLRCSETRSKQHFVDCCYLIQTARRWRTVYHSKHQREDLKQQRQTQQKLTNTGNASWIPNFGGPASSSAPNLHFEGCAQNNCTHEDHSQELASRARCIDCQLLFLCLATSIKTAPTSFVCRWLKFQGMWGVVSPSLSDVISEAYKADLEKILPPPPPPPPPQPVLEGEDATATTTSDGERDIPATPLIVATQEGKTGGGADKDNDDLLLTPFRQIVWDVEPFFFSPTLNKNNKHNISACDAGACSVFEKGLSPRLIRLLRSIERAESDQEEKKNTTLPLEEAPTIDEDRKEEQKKERSTDEGSSDASSDSSSDDDEKLSNASSKQQPPSSPLPGLRYPKAVAEDYLSEIKVLPLPSDALAPYFDKETSPSYYSICSGSNMQLNSVLRSSSHTIEDQGNLIAKLLQARWQQWDNYPPVPEKEQPMVEWLRSGGSSSSSSTRPPATS